MFLIGTICLVVLFAKAKKSNILQLTALFEECFRLDFSLQGEEGCAYKYIWQNRLANTDGCASE